MKYIIVLLLVFMQGCMTIPYDPPKPEVVTVKPEVVFIETPKPIDEEKLARLLSTYLPKAEPAKVVTERVGIDEDALAESIASKVTDKLPKVKSEPVVVERDVVKEVRCPTPSLTKLLALPEINIQEYRDKGDIEGYSEVLHVRNRLITSLVIQIKQELAQCPIQ